MTTPRIAVGELLRSYSRKLLHDFQESTNALTIAYDRGAGREKAVRDFFRERLPGRYGIEDGFVIDAEGSQSKQCRAGFKVFAGYMNRPVGFLIAHVPDPSLPPGSSDFRAVLEAVPPEHQIDAYCGVSGHSDGVVAAKIKVPFWTLANPVSFTTTTVARIREIWTIVRDDPACGRRAHRDRAEGFGWLVPFNRASAHLRPPAAPAGSLVTVLVRARRFAGV